MKRLFISVFLISFILSNNLIAVEKDPITLDDIEKLGQIPKLNKLPDKMFEELKSCKPYNKKFTKCESLLSVPVPPQVSLITLNNKVSFKI